MPDGWPAPLTMAHGGAMARCFKADQQEAGGPGVMAELAEAWWDFWKQQAIVDDQKHFGGTDPANSFTPLPLSEVEALVDFILWDTPTSMLPTTEQVCRIMAQLMARGDADHPIVVAAIAEVWRFLDPDQTARH